MERLRAGTLLHQIRLAVPAVVVDEIVHPLTQEFLRGEAEQLDRRPVDEGAAPLDVDAADPFAYRLQEEPVPGFRKAQRCLDASAPDRFAQQKPKNGEHQETARQPARHRYSPART